MRACPQCASAAPDSAKFCPECGVSLHPRTCPECGQPAESGKFCAECGAALDGQPTASPTQPSTHAESVAERRVTTVLFADLVGFTSLSEGRDPEDVRDLLSRYFAGAST